MLTAVHQEKISCGTQQSTNQFGFLHIGIYSQLAETKGTCNNKNIWGQNNNQQAADCHRKWVGWLVGWIWGHEHHTARPHFECVKLAIQRHINNNQLHHPHRRLHEYDWSVGWREICGIISFFNGNFIGRWSFLCSIPALIFCCFGVDEVVSKGTQ